MGGLNHQKWGGSVYDIVSPCQKMVRTQGTRCSLAGGNVAVVRLPPEDRPRVGVSSCDFPEIDLLAKEAEVMLRNTKPTEGTKARST